MVGMVGSIALAASSGMPRSAANVCTAAKSSFMIVYYHKTLLERALQQSMKQLI